MASAGLEKRVFPVMLYLEWRLHFMKVILPILTKGARMWKQLMKTKRLALSLQNLFGLLTILFLLAVCCFQEGLKGADSCGC